MTEREKLSAMIDEAEREIEKNRSLIQTAGSMKWKE